MISRKIRIGSIAWLGCLILALSASGQALNPTKKDLDRIASFTAEMQLRTVYQKKPVLPVKTAVLADKGSYRIMQASTAVEVCVMKLLRSDDPKGPYGPDFGFAPKETVCWER